MSIRGIYLGRKAFTIVEVLVVVAILSLLAAFVFPIFAAAKRSSKTVACLSNLKQLSFASTLYSADYNDVIAYGPGPVAQYLAGRGVVFSGFPYPDELVSLETVNFSLQPYGAPPSVWRSPLDKISDPYQETRKDTWFEEAGSSYHYADYLALSAISTSSVEEPAKTPLFYTAEPFITYSNEDLLLNRFVVTTFAGDASTVTSEKMIAFRSSHPWWY
jgi:prepilin-type N-terminal cleavage/methylation domain-containing protein